jgi:hypothetical protein
MPATDTTENGLSKLFNKFSPSYVKQYSKNSTQHIHDVVSAFTMKGIALFFIYRYYWFNLNYCLNSLRLILKLLMDSILKNKSIFACTGNFGSSGMLVTLLSLFLASLPWDSMGSHSPMSPSLIVRLCLSPFER